MTGSALIGPMLASVLLVGGWFVAGSRDEHKLPRRGLVGLGQWMSMAGFVLGLLAIPPALGATRYAIALTILLLVGVALVRGAGRNSVGWTSTAEVVTSAVLLSWRTPRRILSSLLSGLAGIGVAVWLAGNSWPLAGLLGGLIALAPARWWMRAGYAREKARTGMEKAMAGVLSGGEEWDGRSAALRGAPAKVSFRNDSEPDSVTYPLPPSWREKETEALEEDMRARLATWGYWLTKVDASKRAATAENVEPLPNMIAYKGETASDRGEVILGLARLSRRASRALGGTYGQVVKFLWDTRVAPHGLVVGTTGGGKSSTFRVIISSWCRHPNKRVVLLDPKDVEFELFRGRRNVLTVAQTVEEMTDALRQVNAEYNRRKELCKKYGVTAVWNLPKEVQPTSWLVITDEVMDFLDKSPVNSDEAKALNDLRAEAIDIFNRFFMKARVMDIHGLLAGQRLDKSVLTGRIQNNAPLRVLTSVTEAGSSERYMIGLQEIEPESAVAGRGVLKSVRFPESEVQLTFLDEDELDRWLPMDDRAEREWEMMTKGPSPASTEVSVQTAEPSRPGPSDPLTETPTSSTGPTPVTCVASPSEEYPTFAGEASPSPDPHPSDEVSPGGNSIDPMKYL